MRTLFIAPRSNLDTNTELTRIVSGTRPEVVNGSIDRAGLTRVIKSEKWDAMHFAGHGGKGVLELADGPLDEADLTSMCADQTRLRFIFINACDSLRVGTALHNELHVPIIAHDSEIGDDAAKRFAETFYRAYQQTSKVRESYDRAIVTLGRLYPDEVNTPVLINGDMATHGEIDDFLAYVTKEIGSMKAQLDSIERDVKEWRKSTQQRLYVPLTVALIMAVLLAPWLYNLFAG